MKGQKHGGLPPVGDQYVAEFSHELGNVLNGLLGMTDLLRDSGLSVEQDRWLSAIEQSCRQLCRLNDAFRYWPTRPGQPLCVRPTKIDGIALLEQALLAHVPAACASADRLLLAVDRKVPRHWYCDPCLLRQLLDNLLGNALKFTQSGEVVLDAVMASAGASAPGTLLLAVVDSGPGVDGTLGQRMFEAFERGPDQVREDDNGRGLGLFICRRIVQALGGAITCSTPAAGGARFEARLPGVLPSRADAALTPPSRILQSLVCQLDLHGTVRRSVAGCLDRLGVAWRAPGRVAEEASRGQSIVSSVDPLLVTICEMGSEPGHPGPHLLLRTETGEGEQVGSRSLHAPILERSLGSTLMELALEWLWLSDERPGSDP